MSTLAKLKARSNGSLDKLVKAVEKTQQTDYNQDNGKYWKYELDKTGGNAYAVLRFMPAAPQDGDDGENWIQYWDKSFKRKGGWYIEKCLTTLKQPDPVVEYCNDIYDTKDQNKIAFVKGDNETRSMTRRSHYVANVYVVKDPKHPENEGKVFLFEFGEKVYEKIKAAIKPEFGEEPMDPFNLFTGADFHLKVKKDGAYVTYSESRFGNPRPLFDDEEKIAQVWEQCYSLKELIDPKNFKSYDELKKRLDRVLGLNVTQQPNSIQSQEQDIDRQFEKVSKPKVDDDVPVYNSPSYDEDDDMEDFFKNIMDED